MSQLQIRHWRQWEDNEVKISVFLGKWLRNGAVWRDWWAGVVGCTVWRLPNIWSQSHRCDEITKHSKYRRNAVMLCHQLHHPRPPLQNTSCLYLDGCVSCPPVWLFTSIRWRVCTQKNKLVACLTWGHVCSNSSSCSSSNTMNVYHNQDIILYNSKDLDRLAGAILHGEGGLFESLRFQKTPFYYWLVVKSPSWTCRLLFSAQIYQGLACCDHFLATVHCSCRWKTSRSSSPATVSVTTPTSMTWFPGRAVPWLPRLLAPMLAES